MKIIIATIKSWNIENANKLAETNNDCEVYVITEKSELNYEFVSAFDPDFIFFPHWSYFIPEEIFANYTCVVFHMTDLPYGRGGSPLQNLIVRGHSETMISAIKVVEEVDAGPIYFKEQLSLDGSADEIFRRAADIIFDKMIPRFMKEELEPIPQSGEVVTFERRKPTDSELNNKMELETVYDYIRMLDGEGYPRAYIEYGKNKMLFSEAKRGFDSEGEYIEAKVLIRSNQ